MKARALITIALLLLVMIFAVQNAQTVELRLLFWEVAFPRSLLIFLMLMIGISVGWFLSSIYRISRK